MSDGDAIREQDILHLGHLKRAFALLDALHDVGCERDTAGNRTLHFDGYCKLVLLYIWNPLIGSVRGLQQALGLPAVAKALGVGRFSLGSFSESVRVFDPDLLRPVIDELAGQLRRLAPQLAAGDPRLAGLEYVLTLVDGTVLRGLERLAKAICGDDARFTTGRDGRGVHGFRLHTQLDLRTFTAARLDLTGARNGGDTRESNVLRAGLEAGRCYVNDGGYADRSLFDDVVAARSVYVTRGAENSVFAVTEERLLSREALDAGVTRDALVTLGDAGADAGPTTSHQVRRVEVAVAPHPRRTRNGTRQTERLILYTCLLDLPPELIALIYLQRYTVEMHHPYCLHCNSLYHLAGRGLGRVSSAA